ncbi:hypothetical protein EV363DRAFT_1309738, partial [Boletus edulis]
VTIMTARSPRCRRDHSPDMHELHPRTVHACPPTRAWPMHCRWPSPYLMRTAHARSSSPRHFARRAWPTHPTIVRTACHDHHVLSWNESACWLPCIVTSPSCTLVLALRHTWPVRPHSPSPHPTYGTQGACARHHPLTSPDAHGCPRATRCVHVAWPSVHITYGQSDML